jgi:hypothetical protein
MRKLASVTFKKDEEFTPGLCVDCGMSVPGGDIICDQCKTAWQLYAVSWYLGRGRDTTVQPGVQELPRQDGVQLVQSEEAYDAQIRLGEEGADTDFFGDGLL